MSDTKRHTSVQERLQAFYRDNPHEELSITDMMAKFDCSRSTIRDAMRSMEGQLEREYVFRLKDRPRAQS